MLSVLELTYEEAQVVSEALRMFQSVAAKRIESTKTRDKDLAWMWKIKAQAAKKVFDRVNDYENN